ncbi:MAG: HDOD domain-containing protein [Deltaproteobacteria bacterium]|nr:HDOD domain-containing protein [Deltaproteobacteria bacterium]
MLRWLLSVLGLARKQHVPPVPRIGDGRIGRPAAAGGAKEARPAFSPEAFEFLNGVVTPCQSLDLQALPPDDRIFLSGIVRRLREKQLEIPVLPRAALEISRVIANPDTNLSEFVRILNEDPALSVDVLRVANSAYYGFSAAARSIRDAVARVGTAQLRALLVVSHIKGKVLRGGSLHREAAWLSELSSALAAVGKALSRHLGLSPDEAFTKGLLFHVEHFLILGTASEVSKEHQRRITPSTPCLREAFWRFGPKVRALAARAWELDDLLSRRNQEDVAARRYLELRRALVASWSGGEPAPIEGIPDADLQEALSACSREPPKTVAAPVGDPHLAGNPAQ